MRLKFPQVGQLTSWVRLLSCSHTRLVTKYLRLDFSFASRARFLYLILPEEILCPSGKSLNSLGNISSSGEVICSMADETISPLGEVSGSLLVLPWWATRIFALKSNIEIFPQGAEKTFIVNPIIKTISSRGNKDLHYEVQYTKYFLKGEKVYSLWSSVCKILRHRAVKIFDVKSNIQNIASKGKKYLLYQAQHIKYCLKGNKDLHYEVQHTNDWK